MNNHELEPWWLYLAGIAFLLHVLTRVLQPLSRLDTRELKKLKDHKEKQRT